MSNAYTFSGYIRRTFRYSPTFSGLDEHTYVGEFRVLSSRVTHESDDMEQTTTRIVTVRVPRSVRSAPLAIGAAIRNEFARGGCTHEYDCCGCWHGGVVGKIRHTKGDEYTALVSYSRNY